MRNGNEFGRYINEIDTRARVHGSLIAALIALM